MTDMPNLEHIDLSGVIDAYARAENAYREAHATLMETRKQLVDVLHRAGVKGFTL